MMGRKREMAPLRTLSAFTKLGFLCILQLVVLAFIVVALVLGLVGFVQARAEPRRHLQAGAEWQGARSVGQSGAKARTDLVCPNCGGPLATKAAGHCSHCQVKVTAGQFEQDESHVGQGRIAFASRLSRYRYSF